MTKPKSRAGNMAGSLAQSTRATLATKEPKDAKDEKDRSERVAPTLGRPRRAEPAARVHLSIGESLVEYLERAWRYHERPSGKLARNASEFVEDLLADHRDRGASHTKKIAS